MSRSNGDEHSATVLFMVATNIGTKSFLERLGRYSTEISVLVILTWIGFHILGAETQGRSMADRERRAYDVVRAIHQGEQAAIGTTGTRFLFLSELIEKSPETSPLRRLTRAEDCPNANVEVYRIRGYLVTVFLNDPIRNDGRAWSPKGAESKEPGTTAYGAFAWPENYQEGTQWAFFVDHRGTVLGSWNHKGAFDGYHSPFPPTINPGKDFREADSQSKTSEWFPFDDVLGEIETPAARELKGKKKT